MKGQPRTRWYRQLVKFRGRPNVSARDIFEEIDGPKGYRSIAQRLRDWESSGYIPAARRTVGQARQWSGDELAERVSAVLSGNAKALTIEEIEDPLFGLKRIDQKIGAALSTLCSLSESNSEDRETFDGMRSDPAAIAIGLADAVGIRWETIEHLEPEDAVWQLIERINAVGLDLSQWRLG